MADRIGAFMSGVDSPRHLPAGIRWRLEHTVAANTTPLSIETIGTILDRPRSIPAPLKMRLTEAVLGGNDADIVDAMDGVDSPRPVPPPMASRIEDTMLNRRRRMMARVYQVSGAAAVAILVIAGAVLIQGENGNPIRPNQAPRIIPPQVFNPPAKVVKPPTKVLGVKNIRIPVATPSGGRARGPVARESEGVFEEAADPQFASEGGRSAFGARASSASGSDRTLDVLSAVTDLINRVLAQIVPAARNAPPPDVNPPAATPQRQAARPARRSRKPAVQKPAAAAPKPATVTVPLLPAIGVPTVTVEVPAGISISL